jgi:OOP family OmpA-OmpF porin
MVQTFLRASKRLAGGCAACVAIAATSGVAHAQTLEIPKYYLAVGALYSEPDNSRVADYGTGGALAYARRFSEHDWIEGRLTSTVLETGATVAVDFYQTTVGADWVRSLGNERTRHFFIAGGGGMALNDVKPDAKDDSSFFLDAAVGMRINASENWGVRPRVELRYVYDSFDSGKNDLMLGLVFEIPPRTERVIEKMVQVEKIVEVPVEVEKIVEKEVGCEQPGAQRPEEPAR